MIAVNRRISSSKNRNAPRCSIRDVNDKPFLFRLRPPPVALGRATPSLAVVSPLLYQYLLSEYIDIQDVRTQPSVVWR